jgi:hypothetical protein
MQKDGTDGANLKKNKTDKNKQRPYNIIWTLLSPLGGQLFTRKATKSLTQW